MATWILFAREEDGEPVVSAMDANKLDKSLTDNSKDNLIGFLKLFSGAGTFLVAGADEADESIASVDRLPQGDGSRSKSTEADATWFHFFRGEDGQPVVVAMNGARGVNAYRGNDKQVLVDFLNYHSNANTFQVASSVTPIPPGIPDWEPVTIDQLTGQRVLLEIGHGPGVPFDPGAIAYDGRTTEHSLNVIAANTAREVLAAAGIACTVIDTPQGSLYDIGLKASGFDVFCSIHHNAANSRAQGTEAFSHATKGSQRDRNLAALISAELSRELGLTDRGEKRAKLGVLSGAEDTNARAAVLAEVYFIDDAVRRPPLTDFSTRGGQAIGRAILKWLKSNP